MTGIQAGYVLLLVALAFAAAGAYQVGLFVSIAAGLVALFAPSPAQRDAARRNHARRLR